MKVAPSILSANFNNLIEEIKSCKGALFIHVDVMDGHFVPNITIGACVIKNLKKETDKILDVHLMITDPYKYAIDFAKAGADIITFHYESDSDVMETIKLIKSYGVKVGLSIKPKTDVSVLLPYLKDLDLVLVMSVEPGFGGQSFIPSALDKIKTLARLKKEEGYSYLIEVDGGINRETAKMVADCGNEVVVAGTYIFKSDNREEVIKYLNSL
ncbi:MAG: ribulose-phosphate 3-epimerase [Bacilli bacterium]|nr:ribulose-phosphate 3-epimerase [Bacilli bacterium]